MAAVEAPPPVPPPVPPPSDSIYEVHLAVDIPVTLVSASIGAVRTIWGEDIGRKSCPCDPASVNAFDRRAIGNHSHAAGLASDLTVWTLMGGLPLLDLADLGWSRAFGEDFVVFAETLTVDTAVQNIFNFVVARPRPKTYAGDPKAVSSVEGHLSFYAGHAATAFAALSAASFTVGRRYGWRVWPWIVTVVVAGSVAVERVASGDHFPTDVLVAAAAGTTFGIAVPWLHVRQRGLPFAVTPAPVGGGAGIAFQGLLP